MIYQVPALIFYERDPSRRCLVVSPLLSLISDQIASLNAKLCVSSGRIARLDRIGGSEDSSPVATKFGDDHSAPIVFITPESLSRSKAFVGGMRLGLIVVDEAHCISSHGLAFRQDYRELDCLRQIHPTVPICALTATAPPVVGRDVAGLLGLRDAEAAVVRAPVDRPNLRLSIVLRKANLGDDALELRQLLGDAQGIVYFPTRAEVERGAAILKAWGVDIAPYHAGLSPQDRQSVQEHFVAGRLKCVAATIAFGMGVDVPGIRCVVHYGLPATLENYVQEIGRAGRDGATSNCLLFWDSVDVTLRARAGRDNINLELAAKGLRAMLDLVQTSGCLRRYVASYFGDEDAESACGARGGEWCSNCRALERNKLFVDYSDDARSLLRTVKLMKVGVKKQVEYHCGSKSKDVDVLRQRHDDAQFGSGAQRPASFWKGLHQRLREKGYVLCNEFGGCYLSAAGEAVLASQEAVVLPEVDVAASLVVPSNVRLSAKKRLHEESAAVASAECVSSSGPLKESLVKFRLSQASQKKVPAFMIFSNKVLENLIAARPSTVEELLKVPGIGPAKASEYGHELVELVRALA